MSSNGYPTHQTKLIQDLNSKIEQLQKENDEFGGRVCDVCDGDGWIYNRVEGRGACACMTERQPFQILLSALEIIAIDKGQNGTPWVTAITALKAVLPLDYKELV